MSNGAGGWRGQPPPMEEGKVAARQGRGRQLVGLLALFLALAAAVIGAIFLLRNVSEPRFQSLAIREYKDSRLPVNAWVVQDAQLLERRFGAADSYAVQTAAKITAELAGLKKHDGAVVLHVCALARVAGDKVYLLPGDADADRSDAWLPLDDVLKRFGDCPASEKLLILDIMRPLADVRLGLYADDVALKTQETLQKADLPFLVLCACSAGQTSQVSQELGQSVFAYYLDQGLAGHADGHGDQATRSRTVSVKELAAFVAGRVDRWAWRNRAVRQTPMLYGAGADFILKSGSGDERAVGENDDEQDEADGGKADGGKADGGKAAGEKKSGYPAWLRTHWAQRDKWQPALARLGPGLLRYLESELLLAEQRWRGGDAERAKTQLNRIVAEAAPHVERVRDHRPPPIFSLRGTQDKSAAALLPALRKLLFQSDNPALKDDKDKAAKEEFDKAVKEMQGTLAKTPKDAALAIFDAAAESERLPQAHFLLLHRLLQGLEFKSAAGERGGPYAETLFVDRVKAFADRVRKSYFDWPAAEVHQALVATQLAETIVADLVVVPELRPWVAKDLDQADDLRRKAEKELFEGFPPWSGVERQLRDAAALYREVQRRMNEVKGARAEWERALRLLPNLAPTLTAERVDHENETDWDQAVAAAENLGARLRIPGTASLDGVAALRRALNDLEQSLAAKEDVCLAGKLGPEDHAQIEALLRSPLLDAGRREKLWKTGRELGMKLLDGTRGQDDLDNAAAEAPAIETLPPDRGAAEREQRRRRWRGREALALVRLAGLAGKLDKDAQAALDSALGGGDEKSWRRFAETISNLWPKHAVAELADPKTDQARADCLTRLLTPFDLRRAGIEPHSYNPALAHYRHEMAALLGHLATRCHGDALIAGPAFRRHYAGAAESYEHEALRWR